MVFLQTFLIKQIALICFQYNLITAFKIPDYLYISLQHIRQNPIFKIISILILDYKKIFFNYENINKFRVIKIN